MIRIRNAREGFTLIELVVVIAILGILAGVASVGYQGYIKKAGEAADQQLLGAVNTAYQAACAELGEIPSEVFASAVLEGDFGARRIGSLTLHNRSGVVDGFFELFSDYFEGNEDKVFRSVRSIVYDRDTGSFEGSDWDYSERFRADGQKEYVFHDTHDSEIVVTEEQRTALLESTFGTAIGVGGLTGEVATMTGAASGIMTESGYSIEGLKEWKGFSSLMATLDLGDDATPEQLSNAVLLYAAQSLDGLDLSLIKYNEDLVNGINTKIKDIIDNDAGRTASEKAVLNAAVQFAIATAYANSAYGRTGEVVVDGRTMLVYDYYKEYSRDFASSISSGSDAAARIEQLSAVLATADNYDKYIAKDANGDYRAFINTMSAISYNIENLDSDRYLSEGITGPYMKEILSLIYG